MPKRLTLEQFIHKSSEVHQNKYSYEHSVYINSSVKIIITCPLHGNFEQRPMDHMRGRGCVKCSLLTQQSTLMSRYGESHPSKVSEFKEKRKQTYLDKYGVNNPSKVSEFKEKRTQTLLKRYGVNNPSKVSEFKERRKQTNLDKYGNEYFLGSDIAISKRINTWLIKYQVNNPRKSIDIIGKIINSKYNTNVTNSLRLLRDQKWLIDQYVNQKKSATTIANEIGTTQTTVCNYLRRYNIEIINNPSYSYKCIQWLESIMESEGIHIQHALNGGEYKIPGTRYKADGYCEETNTVYEFYGDYWHGNPDVYESAVINESTQCTMEELYQKMLLKEENIKELGYNLVVLWENEFENW